MPVTLRTRQGRLIATLTDAQFEQFELLLARERPDDDDYYIDAATLGYLRARECDAAVLEQLRLALLDASGQGGGGSYRATPQPAGEGIDVIWERW